MYYYCIRIIYIVNGCKTYAVIKTSYMRCFKNLWRRSNETINVVYVCVLSLYRHTLSSLLAENQNILIFLFDEFLFDRLQFYLCFHTRDYFLSLTIFIPSVTYKTISSGIRLYTCILLCVYKFFFYYLLLNLLFYKCMCIGLCRIEVAWTIMPAKNLSPHPSCQ